MDAQFDAYLAPVQESTETAHAFRLEQNYPNPFNHVTYISYSVPKTAKVVLKVYNLQGEEVKTLVEKNQIAGTHRVYFDTEDLATGIYFYKMSVGNEFNKVRKMTFIK